MITDAKPWLLRALARSGFLGKYPAYAGVLAGLRVCHNPAVAVMAVSFDGGFRLHVNTEYFASRQLYIDGVLLHEIHHIVYDHVGLARRLDPVHPDLLEIAMECAANEFISEPLPGTPVRWEQFAHLGLRAGQSTLERYDLLCDARRAGRLRDLGWGLLDEHRLLRGEADDGLHPDEATAALAVLLRAAAASAAAAANGPGPARLAGKDPGSLLREVGAALPPPISAIDWRRVLGMPKRRAPLADPRWPSRRFPHPLGQVAGRRRRSNARPLQVLAAIDTSASMRAADLAAAAAQIGRMAAVASVTVVECDVAVRRIYRFEGKLLQVSGGGGTDLRPVFEPAFLAAHAPDAVVYVTDGEGPHPDATPAVPTVWLLTTEQPFGCPWGTRLRLYPPGAQPD